MSTQPIRSDGTPLLPGLPMHADLAPSIVFLVLYLVLLPIFAWRFISRSSRTMVLLRPAIFVVVRLITYVLRAVIADGHYSLGLIITETLLLSIGFILLCLPLVELFGRTAEQYIPGGEKKHWLASVGRLLRLCLLTCIILAVVVSALTDSAVHDPKGSAASTQHSLRIAINAIILAVVGLLILALVRLRASYGSTMNPRTTGFLFVLSVLLGIIAAFRLAQAETATTSTANTSKALFYILFALPEWLAAAMFFAVNIVELFDLNHSAAKTTAYKLQPQQDPEMAHA